jgi:hypothetical protein
MANPERGGFEPNKINPQDETRRPTEEEIQDEVRSAVAKYLERRGEMFLQMYQDYKERLKAMAQGRGSSTVKETFYNGWTADDFNRLLELLEKIEKEYIGEDEEREKYNIKEDKERKESNRNKINSQVGNEFLARGSLEEEHQSREKKIEDEVRSAVVRYLEQRGGVFSEAYKDYKERLKAMAQGEMNDIDRIIHNGLTPEDFQEVLRRLEEIEKEYLERENKRKEKLERMKEVISPQLEILEDAAKTANSFLAKEYLDFLDSLSLARVGKKSPQEIGFPEETTPEDIEEFMHWFEEQQRRILKEYGESWPDQIGSHPPKEKQIVNRAQSIWDNKGRGWGYHHIKQEILEMVGALGYPIRPEVRDIEYRDYRGWRQKDFIALLYELDRIEEENSQKVEIPEWEDFKKEIENKYIIGSANDLWNDYKEGNLTDYQYLSLKRAIAYLAGRLPGNLSYEEEMELMKYVNRIKLRLPSDYYPWGKKQFEKLLTYLESLEEKEGRRMPEWEDFKKEIENKYITEIANNLWSDYKEGNLTEYLYLSLKRAIAYLAGRLPGNLSDEEEMELIREGAMIKSWFPSDYPWRKEQFARFLTYLESLEEKEGRKHLLNKFLWSF